MKTISYVGDRLLEELTAEERKQFEENIVNRLANIGIVIHTCDKKTRNVMVTNK